ncbi:MAG: hypothetical protein HRU33_20995 [Rhodobacteraceae bacterium]|nr:hypothetical protein [Paracoccaceae bacterium]
MIDNTKKNTGTKGTGDRLADGMTVFFRAAGLLGISVMIATLYAADFTHIWYRSIANSDAGFGSGVFGDAFGFTTSIFTGAAFLGLMVTMRLQRIELNEIRQERQLAQKTFDHQLEQSKLVERELLNRTLEERALRLIEIVRTNGLTGGDIHYSDSLNVAELLRTHLDSWDDDSTLEGDIELLQKYCFPDPNYLALKRRTSFEESHAALKAMNRAELANDFLPLLQKAIPDNHLLVYMIATLQSELEHSGSVEEFIPLFKNHEKFQSFQITFESIKTRSSD